MGLILLAGIIFPFPAHNARAQQPDDASPAARPLITLDRLGGYIEVDGDFFQTRVQYADRRNNRRGRSQSNRDLGFREGVGLRLGGTVIDASVMTYEGDLSFSLTQNRFSENGFDYSATDRDTGSLLEYDVRIGLFSGREVSGTVYGLRQDDRINRRFQPTLDERRTGFGTNWYFAHDTVPMELSYDYLESDQSGNRRQRDDEHFIESTLHYGVEAIISETHRVKLSYEHAENKQEYQGLGFPFETTRDLITLDQTVRFGADGRHEYRTLIHWQEESGHFARDFFEIGPQLKLQHTDDLQTFYKYQFNRERYAGLDIETHRADFQVVHQVYSNLTTTVDVFGLYEDVEDDVNTTQVGGSVDWQYNRRNPYGHLYANLALAYDTEDFDGETGVRVVVNESGAFRDPLPIYLRNRDVLAHTIVVTDSSNRRVYVRGLDYAVVHRGNATGLVRVFTGRIANRDTVLIDYQYRVPSEGRMDTVRVDFSAEQRFENGVTPFYRFSYRHQEEDISTGFARRADRTNHHRVGVRYERDRYSVGAELEIFDDSVEPYDAFHVDGVWHIIRASGHTLDASSRFSRFFFEGGFDRRNVSVLDVELDHRWALRDDLSVFERLLFRWEDDSSDGNTHAWDAVAGVEYAVGDFAAQITIEYDRLELPGSEEDNVGVYFNLRRDFPNVLASR